jgi:hypothetical protein
MDPHLLKTVSKGSVDATANGAQRTFRFRQQHAIGMVQVSTDFRAA